MVFAMGRVIMKSVNSIRVIVAICVRPDVKQDIEGIRFVTVLAIMSNATTTLETALFATEKCNVLCHGSEMEFVIQPVTFPNAAMTTATAATTPQIRSAVLSCCPTTVAYM
jgi:hypothetical protein